MRPSNAALMAALMLASTAHPDRVLGTTYTNSGQPRRRPPVQRLSAQVSKEIEDWNKLVDERKAAKKARKA